MTPQEQSLTEQGYRLCNLIYRDILPGVPQGQGAAQMVAGRPVLMDKPASFQPFTAIHGQVTAWMRPTAWGVELARTAEMDGPAWEWVPWHRIVHVTPVEQPAGGMN
jgi:hypothetical protein